MLGSVGNCILIGRSLNYKGQMIDSLSREFGTITAPSLSKQQIICKRLGLCVSVHLSKVEAWAIGDGTVSTNLCIAQLLSFS